MNKRLKTLAPFLICFGIFGLDFFVKGLVLRYAHQFPLFIISFFGKVDLWIDLVYNKGAAWGTFADYQQILFALRCVIVTVVAYLFYQATEFRKKIAFSFVLAGAFGNIYDTIAYGKVIDMIHFIFAGQSYGIFNVADLSIVIGVFVLIFALQDNPSEA